MVGNFGSGLHFLHLRLCGRDAREHPLYSILAKLHRWVCGVVLEVEVPGKVYCAWFVK